MERCGLWSRFSSSNTVTAWAALVERAQNRSAAQSGPWKATEKLRGAPDLMERCGVGSKFSSSTPVTAWAALVERAQNRSAAQSGPWKATENLRGVPRCSLRSEEHTSELQSLRH